MVMCYTVDPNEAESQRTREHSTGIRSFNVGVYIEKWACV